MSGKQPTIEELEKKISGIKNTKARMDILNTIVSGHSQDIYADYSTNISTAKKGLEYKNTEQKKDIEQFIAAIKHVAKTKYKLRHETLCKIADANTLTFTLDFNYESIPSYVSAKKSVEKLETKKRESEKKLSNWKRNMLFRIANGEDFEEFKKD